MELQYITFALIALLLFSVHSIAQKFAIKFHVKDPLVFNFYYVLFSLLFMLPFIFMPDFSVPSSFSDVFWAGITRTIASFLFLYALKKLDVSVVFPLFNLRIITSSILAALFLGEILAPQSYIWVAVIIFAGFFVAIEQKKGKLNLGSFFQPAILIFIGHLFFSSASSIFINKSLEYMSFWTFNVWFNVFIFLTTLLSVPFILNKIKIPWKSFWVLGSTALLLTLAQLFENASYSSNVTISTIILALPGPMLLAFIVSRLKPKLIEDQPLKVYFIRFLAAGFMILATLMIIL